MPSAMRPMRAGVGTWGGTGGGWPARAGLVNERGSPLWEPYMPLLGDCGAPSALDFWPARQPTAARTAPGFAFSPVVFAFARPWTTTSVTMFARKQSFAVTG